MNSNSSVKPVFRERVPQIMALVAHIVEFKFPGTMPGVL